MSDCISCLSIWLVSLPKAFLSSLIQSLMHFHSSKRCSLAFHFFFLPEEVISGLALFFFLQKFLAVELDPTCSWKVSLACSFLQLMYCIYNIFLYLIPALHQWADCRGRLLNKFCYKVMKQYTWILIQLCSFRIYEQMTPGWRVCLPSVSAGSLLNRSLHGNDNLPFAGIVNVHAKLFEHLSPAYS